MELLGAKNISKSFGPVRVLDDVSFDLRAGEVHILAGENGAGKSTLIKIIAGLLEASQGTVDTRGRVAVIHQELSLVDAMSVEDNIFLGRELTQGGQWLDHKTQLARAREACRLLDLDIDLSKPVETYPMSVKNRIEIAKALSLDARIIIMDEPTSALTRPECERFFELIERLKSRGCGIVYISHKMDEIYRLADRITVLRDGRHIGTAAAAELPEREFVRWMIGRELTEQFPARTAGSGRFERLRVDGLSVAAPAGAARPWLVRDVSFSARAGEIVGFAGLQGAGCTELFSALFGAAGRRARGRVTLDDRELAIGSPRAAWNAGIAYLTNDRKDSGLVLGMSISDNITLSDLARFSPGGWLAREAERKAATARVRQLRIRSSSIDQRAEALSGGNQQKIVLARCLETRPRLLLLDEPTRGVDVGAKHEIYELMNRLTAEGVTILMISTELPELLAMSDRVVVMHRGQVSGHFYKDEATQEKVLRAAMSEGVA